LLLLPMVFYISSSFAYTLSICAIFQDEAEWLKEWIEYHRLLGVEHFLLYNNNSKDDYQKVLAPYIKKGIVQLLDCPSPPHEDWTPYQRKAYNDAISRMKGKTKWLAVIDIDEFIVVTDKGKTIPQILKRFYKLQNVGGVLLHWQMFGTSGLWEIPPGKTMIECLIRRGVVNAGPNQNCKTICRPERVQLYFVHGANYLPGYNGKAMDQVLHATHRIPLGPMHINHYWTRTKKFVYDTKIPRRERCEKHPLSPLKIQQLAEGFNEVEDKTILQWLPQLREKLFPK
jgi:Glycosyltransferase family 92